MLHLLGLVVGRGIELNDLRSTIPTNIMSWRNNKFLKIPLLRVQIHNFTTTYLRLPYV